MAMRIGHLVVVVVVGDGSIGSEIVCGVGGGGCLACIMQGDQHPGFFRDLCRDFPGDASVSYSRHWCRVGVSVGVGWSTTGASDPSSIMALASANASFSASFAGIGLHYEHNLPAPEVQAAGRVVRM